MDIGSIFLILAVLLLVLLYVGRPFLDGRSSLVTKESQEMSHLLAERDRVLNALQELEFDFQLGKIPAEDYPQQRELMLRHGAETLRQIDELQTQNPIQDFGRRSVSEQAAGPKSVEDRIEAAVAARRMVARGLASADQRQTASAQAVSAQAVPAQPDDEVEALLAERRRARSGKSAGFCHKCGGALQTTDRFCPKCGTPSAVAN